ncbi:acid-sensing ion channel 1B-like [Saccoglossus kowalevskii]|uniref:Acid-sensing ion channel 1-like n=1 Tax=Saccoglossus kowalevskii TaxID=10224 RepID=A0ABM0MQM4_SACKO|nr:PREDICTED: acid-sensing ion channel 1-like [Saccoglossus kowalevskii]
MAYTFDGCQWNGRECEEEAISHVFTHYGSCYAFNKYHPDTDHYHSKRAGTDNGLRLIINVNTHEHMPTIDLEDSAINVGLKLMIHSRQEPPYVKELGFALGAGSHYFMSLTRKKITRLSQPYGDCEPVVLPTEHYDHYSMSACRIECETELLLKHCGCRLVEQPGDYQVCTAERVHNCAHKTLDEYIEGYLPFECKHTCHTPCESEVYSFTMSTALLKKDIRRSNKAMSNYTLEHIRENVLALTMFFEELNFETVDQLPETTIIDLLGIIGGNMGLFLGASFLTLLQIVEYLLDECVHCCKRAGRRKSSRNRTKKQRLDDREVHAPLSLPERPRTRMFMNTTV